MKKTFQILIVICIAMTMGVVATYAQCTNQCLADAGPNKTICCPGGSVTIGPTGCKCAILNSTPTPCSSMCNGTTYSWSPTTGLSNPNICNPSASPTTTTTYTLTVTFGSRCCCDGDTGDCANDTCSGGQQRTDQMTVTVNNTCCFKPGEENPCSGTGTY